MVKFIKFAFLLITFSLVSLINAFSLEELKFIPADFNYLSGVKFDRITKEFKKYEESSKEIIETELLEEMTKDFGVDIFNDVNRIYSAGKLAPTIIEEIKTMVVIIKGKFNRNKIYESFSRMNPEGIEKVIEGKKYIEAGQGCLFVYSKEYLIISDKESFDRVIKVLAGEEKSLATSEFFNNYIDSLSEETAVWNYVDISFRLKGEMKRLAASYSLNQSTMNLIDSLEAFSMTIEILEEDYRMSSNIICSQSKASQSIADFIKSYVNLFKRLMLNNVKSLTKLFDALTIQNEEKAVNIIFKLDKDDAHQILRDFRAFRLKMKASMN